MVSHGVALGRGAVHAHTQEKGGAHGRSLAESHVNAAGPDGGLPRSQRGLCADAAMRGAQISDTGDAPRMISATGLPLASPLLLLIRRRDASHLWLLRQQCRTPRLSGVTDVAQWRFYQKLGVSTNRR
ncbi:hypothetical protein MRX96_005318 [Rhipicephalus microplus]